MARLGGDGDVRVRITTEYDGKGMDEAKKDFASVSASAETMGASSDKVSRELNKLGNASEWVGGGVKRFRGVLEGMAFGGAIGVFSGLVTAATGALIDHFKQLVITREEIERLNESVIKQADAWMLLPDPMKAVSRETVALYNAQLNYSRLLALDQLPGLKRQIGDLERLRDEAAKNKEVWAGEFGPAMADNSKVVAKYEIDLARLNLELKKQQEILKLTPATVDEVNERLRKNKEENGDVAEFFGSFLTGAGMLRELEKSPLERLMGAGGPSFDVEARLQPWMLYYEGISAGERDLNKKLVDIAAEREAAVTRLAEIDLESPYGGGGPIGEAYSKGFGGKYEAEIRAMQDFNTRKLQLMVDAGATQFELETEYEHMTTQMKQQEYQLRLGSASTMVGSMANLFQNLYVASGKKNRELFEAGKIFAIAQATVDTYAGATAAYKALAGISVVGPALATAAAASIIAAGLANVKTIASTQPGGGAISAGGAAMPSYSGGSYDAYPVPQKIEESNAKPQIVFKVEHMELLDENSVILLMERISRMAKDYDVTLEATRVN